MKRRWPNEYPGFPVPDAIDRLVRIGCLIDTSSATDTCPSFHMRRRDEALCLWVDHPDPDRREFRPPTRFAIEAMDVEPQTDCLIFPFPARPLLETDTIEEVLAFLARFEHEPLLPSPPHRSVVTDEADFR